jgi:exopolyphosphatase/guanosine-5'-triphosphate,3'-diphosphate pyrophosphatase
MQSAIAVAGQFASQIDPFVKEKLENPHTKVLAVGNLFNYGIRPLVKHSIINAKPLEEAILKLSGKSDSELPGGSLAEVAVTNPLLVLGYMKNLQIKQIEVVNVNNADGALTYPPYWIEEAKL